MKLEETLKLKAHAQRTFSAEPSEPVIFYFCEIHSTRNMVNKTSAFKIGAFLDSML